MTLQSLSFDENEVRMPQEMRIALEKIVDYMEEMERDHYEGELMEGYSSEGHIYHWVLILKKYLQI